MHPHYMGAGGGSRRIAGAQTAYLGVFWVVGQSHAKELKGSSRFAHQQVQQAQFNHNASVLSGNAVGQTMGDRDIGEIMHRGTGTGVGTAAADRAPRTLAPA